MHRLVASAATTGSRSNPQGDRHNEVAPPSQSLVDEEINTLRAKGMNNRKIKAYFAEAAANGDAVAVEKMKQVNAALQPRGSQEFRD